MSSAVTGIRRTATAAALAILATAFVPTIAQAAEKYLYDECKVRQTEGDKGDRYGKIFMFYTRNSSHLTITKYEFNLLAWGGGQLGDKNNVEFWLMKKQSGKDAVLDHWKSGDNVKPKVRTISSDDTDKRVRWPVKGTTVYVKAKFIFDDRGVADVSCTAVTGGLKV